MPYLQPFNLKTIEGPRSKLVAYMHFLVRDFLVGSPIPYVWGGQSLSKGLDCSGLVIVGLQQAEILPEGFATNAHGLWKKFKTDPPLAKKDLLPGDLAFFGKNRVSHVGMLYFRGRKGWVMVEAGGGGKFASTGEKGRENNAYVSPIEISNRKDLKGFGKVC